MDINIFSIMASMWTAFSESTFFLVIKVIAGIAIVVLLIADILLLSKRLRGDIKIAVYGAKVPSLKKTEYTKKWESIRKRVSEGSVASGKIAIIEADKMLGDVLEKVGYKGADTGEKISKVKPAQMIGLEKIIESHQAFVRIIQDPTYEISLDEINLHLDNYENVFRGLELLD